MKILTIFLTVTILFISTIVFGQSGTLDNDFGDEGISLHSVTGVDGGADVFILDDEKILSMGNKYTDNITSGILLIRYNADGTVDNTFANNGVNIIEIPDCPVVWGEEFEVKDEFIFISGGVYGPDAFQYLVVKCHLNDGTLDNSFGSGGYVITSLDPLDSGGDLGYAIGVQTDGKVVIGGKSGQDIGVIRYNTEGSLDNTFGTDGVLILDNNNNNNDFCYAVDLLPDGKIVISGYTTNQNAIPIVVRLNADGTLDNLFGTGGKVILNDYEGIIYDQAIQSDGKLLIAGETAQGQAMVIRINPNGSLDDTFSTSGRFVLPTPSGYVNSRLWSISLQEDGKPLLGGFVDYTGLYETDLLLARLDEEGNLDNTFGDNGIGTIINLGNPIEEARGIAVQTDNKIVCIGSKQESSSSNEILLARYNGDFEVGIFEANLNKTLVSISPNPVNTKLNILSNHDNLIEDIKIFDLSGQTVYSKKSGNQQMEIDVSYLSNGIYFLKLYSKHSIEIKKFVKE